MGISEKKSIIYEQGKPSGCEADIWLGSNANILRAWRARSADCEMTVEIKIEKKDGMNL